MQRWIPCGLRWCKSLVDASLGLVTKNALFLLPKLILYEVQIQLSLLQLLVIIGLKICSSCQRTNWVQVTRASTPQLPFILFFLIKTLMHGFFSLKKLFIKHLALGWWRWFYGIHKDAFYWWKILMRRFFALTLGLTSASTRGNTAEVIGLCHTHSCFWAPRVNLKLE